MLYVSFIEFNAVLLVHSFLFRIDLSSGTVHTLSDFFHRDGGIQSVRRRRKRSGKREAGGQADSCPPFLSAASS